MPALTYSVADFQAFTKIKSADVNSKFSDISTLLNVTLLNDANIQDAGITRATKLTAGTAQTIVINGALGAMDEIAIADGGLLSQTAGSLAAAAAGTQGQLLQSTGTGLPTWIDSPFVLPSHYIKSAAVDADGQQLFMTPDGGGADDLTILATTTNLVTVIENTEYTLAADVAVTGLDPISVVTANITATVNDASLADELWTKQLGELDAPILLDGVGSEIVSKAGLLAAFRLDTGAGSEYLLGRVKSNAASGAAEVVDCQRGYFVNSSGAGINRIVLADNDTLTLMNLYWIFLDSAGTAHTTTLEPIYSDAEPSSPTTGQYWFDYGANQWKTYNGASFDVQTRIPIGQAIVDENDAVVGTRSFDIFSQVTELNTITLEDITATTAISSSSGEINVLGTLLRFQGARLRWDITNTDQRVPTEAASTWYYLYLSSTGALKIDDVAPYNRPDLKGRYHPHKPWRNVGTVYNDSSSDLVTFWDTRPDQALAEYVPDITGSTTDPTKGTVSRDTAFPRRHADGTGSVNYDFVQTGGGAAGSGNYYYSLPEGVNVDFTRLNTDRVYGPCWTGNSFTWGVVTTTSDFSNAFVLYTGNQANALQIIGSTWEDLNGAIIYSCNFTGFFTRQFSAKDLR